jgi:hypothetical protein
MLATSTAEGRRCLWRLGIGAVRVGSKRRAVAVKWTAAPAAHDYPAAAAYLGLLAGTDLVQVLTALLSQAPTVHHAAKDILRAARLELLGPEDLEVAKDLKKIGKGVELSPVLIVRGDLASGRPLQIADGYHRVCASYHTDEDVEVSCRVIDLPRVGL